MERKRRRERDGEKEMVIKKEKTAEIIGRCDNLFEIIRMGFSIRLSDSVPINGSISDYLHSLKVYIEIMIVCPIKFIV